MDRNLLRNLATELSFPGWDCQWPQTGSSNSPLWLRVPTEFGSAGSGAGENRQGRGVGDRENILNLCGVRCHKRKIVIVMHRDRTEVVRRWSSPINRVAAFVLIGWPL